MVANTSEAIQQDRDGGVGDNLPPQVGRFLRVCGVEVWVERSEADDLAVGSDGQPDLKDMKGVGVPQAPPTLMSVGIIQLFGQFGCVFLHIPSVTRLREGKL